MWVARKRRQELLPGPPFFSMTNQLFPILWLKKYDFSDSGYIVNWSYNHCSGTLTVIPAWLGSSSTSVRAPRSWYISHGRQRGTNQSWPTILNYYGSVDHLSGGELCVPAPVYGRLLVSSCCGVCTSLASCHWNSPMHCSLTFLVSWSWGLNSYVMSVQDFPKTQTLETDLVWSIDDICKMKINSFYSSSSCTVSHVHHIEAFWRFSWILHNTDRLSH